METTDITSFRGEYRWLSNFYPARMRFGLEWYEYPTSEHAYQASKSVDPATKALFTVPTLTPGEAKQMGKSITIHYPDWGNICLDMMYKILYAKFDQHPELAKKLLDTYPRNLVEGNTWGDTFWGVCNGVGTNHLGKTLMQVRDNLKFYKENGLVKF